MKLSRYALNASMFLLVMAVPRVSQAFLIPIGVATQNLVDKFLLERLKKEKLPANNDASIRGWADAFVSLYGKSDSSRSEDNKSSIALFMKDFYAQEGTDTASLLRVYLDVLSPRVAYAFTAVLENNLKLKKDSFSKDIVKMATKINKDLLKQYEKSTGATEIDVKPMIEDAD